MRHVTKGVPYLLPFVFLLSFLYFLFPESTEPQTSAITALAPLELWSGGFSQLRGITVDDNGLVYVADRIAGIITRIEADQTKTIVAQGLQHPVGLAFDLNGRLLIAEETSGQIVRLEEDGTLTPLVQGIERPRWLAFGEEGTLYISAHDIIQGADPGSGDETIEPEKILSLTSMGQLTVFAEDFQSLQGLAVLDSTLYAATKGLKSDSTPKGIIFQIPILADGSAGALSHFGPADSLKKPVGLTFDRLGALFASTKDLSIDKDKSKQAIAKLLPDGTIVSFASNLDDPRGIAFDQQGNLYLADGNFGNVLRFLAPPSPTVDVPAFTNQSPITVTGVTEPNSRIDAFLNDSTTPTTILTTDGTFSLDLDLTTNNQNLITVFTTAQNGNGLTSAPAEFTIVHDVVAPVIANLIPISGAFLNNPTPQISAGFSDGGSGADPDNVQILLNGSDITSQAQVTASGFTLNPSIPLVQGLYLLTVNATDFAGNLASVSFNFTVDLTPPVITNLTPVDGATVTTARPVISAQFSDNVSGINPASAQILLDGQNLTSQAAVNTSGFTLDLTNLFDLTVGAHTVSVAVFDRANNSASASSTFTRATPLQVDIITPVAGATVESGSLLVTGTVDAQGSEVGVSVNGFPAAVQGNSFAVLVPVTADTTSLTAAAATAGGATATHTIAVTVTETAAPSALLHASPTSGVAPLTVDFSHFGGVVPTQVELDADSDGLMDFSGTELQEQPFTYTQPGVYVATATVTDDQGNQSTASAIVQVYDQAELDALLKAKWTGMKDALRQGDIAGAVTYIAELSRSRYEEAFQILQSRLSEIDQILTNVTFVEMRNNSAIYEAARTDADLEKSFEVRFALDLDGVWKIESF